MDYVGEIYDYFEVGKWWELDDVFWIVILFGMGGWWGKMYLIGSNVINDCIIGESV